MFTFSYCMQWNPAKQDTKKFRLFSVKQLQTESISTHITGMGGFITTLCTEYLS